ncbi:mycothiol synthase [Cryobacterium psychrophilum]|uniref:Mycothiol acetyltransferase n=1 Tax=Cryobacterium psychrophilum TaxID=41988 RepID=A0A4Y8KS64_9MICO|nr:mycothiol synthase [Cryobacterium psychrophilum]TDW29546.1 mycothiol synthase [Cryobacterium psychrophilum]TFD81681.1 mycothiol synthase [Cryobacterium psychrophilum]
MNAYPTPFETDPVTLVSIEASDTAGLAAFEAVAVAALDNDGYEPFNEQTMFDVRAGKRTGYVVSTGSTSEMGATSGQVVGAAVEGAGEVDLVVAPAVRRRGYGRAALATVLQYVDGEVTAWSHGDHPGARGLAAHFHFEKVRTLLELRMPLGPQPQHPLPEKFVIDTFRPETDAADWVALNAHIFAAHPEQGGVTVADLTDRQAEHWFEAEDFLIARDRGGRMVGYNWLKVEGDVGEIYVLGVHPGTAGAGLGRALMLAGLKRLSARGCTTASLYVEADSVGPVHLYRSLGFSEHTVDVQYRRLPV